MHTLHGKDLWRIGPAVVGVLILVGVATGLGITKAVGCSREADERMRVSVVGIGVRW
jgi:hypothetical protein